MTVVTKLNHIASCPKVASESFAVSETMEAHLFQALSNGICNQVYPSYNNQDEDDMHSAVSTLSQSAPSPGLTNPETDHQPPEAILKPQSKPMRKSSMTHNRVSDFTVSDLYRCRTVNKLVSKSKLMGRAQLQLIQDTPTFVPGDFGLDYRFLQANANRRTASDDSDFDPFSGGNKTPRVIGQSSQYFTIYGLECATISKDQTTIKQYRYGQNNPETTQEQVQQSTLAESRYVLKKVNHALLSPEAVAEKPKAVPQAAITLAIEAHFLASVSHPHILAIRGIADPSMTPLSQMFFLVDRLEETLDKRISQRWKGLWEKNERRNNNTIRNIFGTTDRRRKKHQIDGLDLQLERHIAARDLTSALAHLHQHRILHRDLKPENVGFTFTDESVMENTEMDPHYHVYGKVQLFDFGIATELPDSSADGSNEECGSRYRAKDETFLLTPTVGSIRYMAPEVYLGRNYGTSADVYSLSIILYEIFSLCTPFDELTESCMKALVFERGMRPGMDIPSHFSDELRELIPRSWSQTHLYRPSAQEIFVQLDQIVLKLHNSMDSAIAEAEAAEEALGRPLQRRGSLKGALKKVMPRRLSLDMGLRSNVKEKSNYSLDSDEKNDESVQRPSLGRRHSSDKQRRLSLSGKNLKSNPDVDSIAAVAQIVTRQRRSSSMGHGPAPATIDSKVKNKLRSSSVQPRKSFNQIMHQHQLYQMALSIEQEQVQVHEEKRLLYGTTTTENRKATQGEERAQRRNSATKFSPEITNLFQEISPAQDSDKAMHHRSDEAHRELGNHSTTKSHGSHPTQAILKAYEKNKSPLTRASKMLRRLSL